MIFMCCYFLYCFVFFFFKQKTAYEMRISDWSSDVCSSDLGGKGERFGERGHGARFRPECCSAKAVPLFVLLFLYSMLNTTDMGCRNEIGRASCRERVCQYV